MIGPDVRAYGHGWQKNVQLSSSFVRYADSRLVAEHSDLIIIGQHIMEASRMCLPLRSH